MKTKDTNASPLGTRIPLSTVTSGSVSLRQGSESRRSRRVESLRVRSARRVGGRWSETKRSQDQNDADSNGHSNAHLQQGLDKGSSDSHGDMKV